MGSSFSPDSGCRLFINRAQQAVQRSEVDPPTALDAILYSAVAVEGFPNDFVKHIERVVGGEKESLPSSLQAIYNILPDLEEARVQLRTKYKIMHYLLAGTTPDPGKQPWQDFEFLLKLRNEMVHPKCGDIENVVPPKYPKKSHDLIAGLRARNISHFHAQDVVSWPWTKHLENQKAAAWAVRTACSVIKAICDSVPAYKYSHWFQFDYYTKPYAGPSTP